MGDIRHDWAENEIKLYCEKNKVGEFNYGRPCAKSAMKAYDSLLEDEHSGLSLFITKNLLNRLIDGKPLTPIEDTPEVWDERPGWSNYEKVYQCKRMPSLFKKVQKDGTIIFSENDRIRCKDIKSGEYFYSTLADRLVNEKYPITFPYIGEDKFVVYTKDFRYNDGYDNDEAIDHIAFILLANNGEFIKDWDPKYFDLRGGSPKEIPGTIFYEREMSK